MVILCFMAGGAQSTCVPGGEGNSCLAVEW